MPDGRRPLWLEVPASRGSDGANRQPRRGSAVHVSIDNDRTALFIDDGDQVRSYPLDLFDDAPGYWLQLNRGRQLAERLYLQGVAALRVDATAGGVIANSVTVSKRGAWRIPGLPSLSPAERVLLGCLISAQQIGLAVVTDGVARERLLWLVPSTVPPVETDASQYG